MIKLKLSDMTAEGLSLARPQRMNRNTVGTVFLTRWRKLRRIIIFLTHLGTYSKLTKVAYQ